MPPLTDEFIEALKQDLQNNPIDVERPCSTASNGKKSSKENLWQNWQNTFDRHCMDWDTPDELTLHFESTLRNCEEWFPEYPVAIKGNPRQQMELMLVVWYLRPDILLRQHNLLHAFMSDASECGRTDGYLDLIHDNREQLLAVFYFAGSSHLKPAKEKFRQRIVAEAGKEHSSLKTMAGKWWWHVHDDSATRSLEDRVSGFLENFAFASVAGDFADSLPSTGSDAEEFLQEMWRQNAGETIRYTKTLRKNTVGDVLHDLPLTTDEKDRLCISCDVADLFLQCVDAADASPSEKRLLEGYRADFSSRCQEVVLSGERVCVGSSKNKITGADGTVLEWNDDFSVVWRNGVEVEIQKTRRPPMIKRVLYQLIQWYREGKTDASFEELNKVLDTNVEKYRDLFRGYEDAQDLIMKVPQKPWMIRLNL